MKTNKLKMVGLLMSIAATLSVASCSPDDNNDINGSNNDNNGPLTEESIVGKKFYTNKMLYKGYWHQSEIRFASNNTAYLTWIETDYTSGQEHRSDQQKATFNLDYPDVMFETEEGKLYPAIFTDNNLLVFDGYNLTDLDEEKEGAPESWGYVKGWHFRTNPQTITGPYLGQVFYGTHEEDIVWKSGKEIYTFETTLYFGANTAYVYEFAYGYSNRNVWGQLSVNYPNFTIMDNYSYSGNCKGRFVDANTIVITEFKGRPVNQTLTRIR